MSKKEKSVNPGSNYKSMVIGIFLVTSVLAVYLSRSEPIPADVMLAQAIQYLFGHSDVWAQAVSGFASFPYCFLMMTFGVILSWWGAGKQAALMSLVCFGSLWLTDKLLRLVIYQPRPSEELINVVSLKTSSAFPSTSAILYGAVFLYLLFLAIRRFNHIPLKIAVSVISVLALVTVFCARVVLGAHWPTDMFATFLVAGLLAALAVHFVPPSST